MPKATIVSLNRGEKRLVLKFRKNQQIVKLLLQLADEFKINWDIFQYRDENSGDMKIANIKDIEDELYHYEDRIASIDIFIGSRKIIFVLNASEKVQQNFLDKITKKADWVKTPKLAKKRR
jgi:hypothetical protein